VDIGRPQTQLTIEGLVELQQYLMVVIAIDERGDATALFSRATNMLLFNLVHPGAIGPILSVYGAVTYRMPSGASTTIPQPLRDSTCPRTRS
jgi:hypothetical protein